MKPLDGTQAELAAACIQCLQIRSDLPFDACRQFVVLPDGYSKSDISAVTRMMKSRGMIKESGKTQAVSPTAHGRPVAAYRLASKSEASIAEFRAMLGKKFPEVDRDAVLAIKPLRIYREVKPKRHRKRKPKPPPSGPSLFGDDVE